MIVFEIVVVYGTLQSYAYRPSKREALSLAKRTIRFTSPTTVSVYRVHLKGLTPRKLVLACLNHPWPVTIERTLDALTIEKRLEK